MTNNPYPELTIDASKAMVEQGEGTYDFALPDDAAELSRIRARVVTAAKRKGLAHSTKVDRENGCLTVTLASLAPKKTPRRKRGSRTIHAGRALPAGATTTPEPTPEEPYWDGALEYTSAVLVGPSGGIVMSDPEVLVVHTVEELYSNDVEAVQRVLKRSSRIETATGKEITTLAYKRLGELLGVG